MLFYLTLFILIIFFSFSYSRTKDVVLAEFSKIFVFLLMFVPAALRYGVGTDYFAYVNIFNEVSRGVGLRIEPGYVALNQWCYYLGLDVQSVFAVMAFLTLFFLFLAVPRKSFYIIVPIYFCIFYAFSYNGVRNALTVTMGYYAYHLFSKKKILFSLVLVYIGSLFHFTSFLFYPVFIVMALFKIDKNQSALIFLFSFAVLLFGSAMINFILNTIVSKTPYVYHLLGNMIQKRGSTGFFSMVHYFVFALVLIFLPNIKDKETSNILILFLISNFAYILGSVSEIFGRLNDIFAIAWFPMIHYININKTKYRKMLLLFIFTWAALSFIAAVGFLGSANMLPYRTIFNKN